MKVNLPKSQHKKSFFPISFDSSTTANFGEVLPVFCKEVVPETHVSFQMRNAVRFAPLSFPTFGESYLKSYAFCHKLSDLYPPFLDMLAQTPFTASNGSTYVPTEVPNVPLWFLWLSVLSNADFSLHATSLSGNITEVNGVVNGNSDFKFPFINTQLDYKPITIVTSESSDGSTNDTLTLSEVSYSLAYWLLMSLHTPNSHLPSFLRDDLFVSDEWLAYMRDDTSSDKIFMDNQASNLGNNFVYSESDGHVLVTPENADFVFPLTNNIFGYFNKTDESGNDLVYNNDKIGFYFDSVSPDNKATDVLVCLRLNDSGKFLRKILMGLGYQIAPLYSKVSILPIYAYFKSYFDTFAPKRFVKFEQTYFSRLINQIVTTGSSVVSSLLSMDNSDYQVRWNNIIDDLLSCFYTKDTDYFSAQIIGMINDYGSNLQQSYVGVGENEQVEFDSVSSNVSTNANAGLKLLYTTSGDMGPETHYVEHTQAQQNILSRLTQFINRRSTIGANLASLLKSVFGISSKEVDEYNAFIGSSSIDISISDVFSTAETTEGSLGEYAGKATSTGFSDVFNIDTDVHSLILAVSVVVPRTQFVQGVEPTLSHVFASSFYNPLFDGLTLLPTRKSSFFTGNLLYGFSESEDLYGNSFGNLPIYSEYKTKACGILSGDLSLRSTRSTYDSFTMDEIISDSDSVIPSDHDPNSGTFRNLQYNFKFLVCGTMWRYLGRWLWLGRFDRIFLNNRFNYTDFISSLRGYSQSLSSRNLYRSDDNLILHHIIDLKLNSPMVPLAGSWMTDDMLALDDNSLKVNVQ